MKKRVKRSILLMLMIIIPVTAVMVSATYEEEDSLFTLKRNIDEDVLHYVLNLDAEGNLIKEDPIRFFWVPYGDSAVERDLSVIQKNFVYGIKYTMQNEDFYEFHLQAYKHDLYLKKSSKGDYKVVSKFDDKYVIVKQIFIQIDKLGTLAHLPEVAYVDVHWYSPKDREYGVTRVDVNE